MKKRSEIRKRSEVSTTKPEAPTGTVHCNGCDEDIVASTIVSFAEDKSGECPKCGDKIPLSAINAAYPEGHEHVVDEHGDVGTRAELAAKAKTEEGPLNPDRKWCGTCGSEWPVVNGKFMINCGHTHAARVDDPRKAEKYAPPAGLQGRSAVEVKRRDEADARKMSMQSTSGDDADVLGPPPKKEDTRDTSGFNTTAPAPKITIEGNRLSVEWGKSTFPLGMMMNFTIGGYFASIEHAPGKRLEAFREIMSDFEKMASEAFATQSAWYQKKLGTLK